MNSYLKSHKHSRKPTREKILRALVIIAVILATGSLTLHAFSPRMEFTVIADSFVLPANGMSVTTLRAETPFALFTKPVRWRIARGASRVEILEATPSLLTLQSTLKTGDVVIEATRGKQKKKILLHLVPDEADSDGDGFPDVAELTSLEDKTAFVKRFVSAARAQYEKPSPRWSDGNRDCAGLVRYAYQQALKKQEEAFVTENESVGSFSMPEVKKFNYPHVPELGKNIFRTKKGTFSESDIKDNVFSTFVDSRALMEFNTRFVSKDMQKAQEGDLLFFLHFDDLSMPYHAMICAGGDEKGKEWLVYHTGPVHKTKGKVKMITLDTLLNYDDERWHPVRGNPYFLGVYRFNIVE